MIPNSPELVVNKTETRRAAHDADLAKYLLIVPKRIAARDNLPFTITKYDFEIPTHCPETGLELKRGDKARQPEAPSLQMVDPALGYVPGNVRVVSYLATTAMFKAKQSGFYTCPKCGKSKALTEFYSNGPNATSIGFCKECKDGLNKHPKHKTKNAARKHRTYVAFKDEILAANKQYKLDNPEKVAVWRARDRARVEKHLLHGAKSRAEQRGTPFNISLEDIVISENCPVLDLKLERGKGKIWDASPTLDCLVPELGYVRGNINVISHKANTIKQNATPEEIYLVADWVSDMIGKQVIP